MDIPLFRTLRCLALGLGLCGITPPALSAQSFAIFETRTPAGAVSGRIYDKRINVTITLDAQPLINGQVDPSYNDKKIDIYLLNARDNSGPLDAKNCRSTWIQVGVIPVAEMTFHQESRKTFTFTYPTVIPSARLKVMDVNHDIGCSNDSFAILDTPPSSPYTFQLENN